MLSTNSKIIMQELQIKHAELGTFIILVRQDFKKLGNLLAKPKFLLVFVVRVLTSALFLLRATNKQN